MDRLIITATVLDKLGFSDYHDEDGTWGGRVLTFKNGVRFRIVEQEEMDDINQGYANDKLYVSNHYYFVSWFAIPKIEGLKQYDIFFLHEMYQCIKEVYPDCIGEFTEKCRELNMHTYLVCDNIDDIYKGKSRQEIIDLIYDFHLQNTNGRETSEEMFRKGIEACYEELFSGLDCLSTMNTKE